MADIVLAAGANWSTCKAGGAPAATDNIYLNGFALTLDGAAGATYTCALIKACAVDGTTATAGNIILTAASGTIHANLVAGAGQFFAVSGKTVGITGNVTGGTVSSAFGVFSTGTTTLTITGNVTGGSANSAYGVRIAGSTDTLTVNGIVSGSSTNAAAAGLWSLSGGVVTVTTAQGTVAHGIISAGASDLHVGTAIGGTVAGIFGVSISGTGVATIGVAKGGTTADAFGVSGVRGTAIVLNGTDLSGTAYPVATLGLLQVAAGVVLQFDNQAGALLPFYPGVVSAAYVLAGHDNYSGGTAGTLTLPAVGKVDTTAGTYGVGGTGSTPTLNMALYTLSAGMVWPTAVHVTTAEANYGPTGSEYHGTIDMTLYMLNSVVASDYTINTTVAANYNLKALSMLNTIVASDYTADTIVASDYNLKTLSTLNTIVASDYTLDTVVASDYNLKTLSTLDTVVASDYTVNTIVASDYTANTLVVSADYVLTGHDTYPGGPVGLVILPAAWNVRLGTFVGLSPTVGTMIAGGTGQARVIGG